MNNVLVTGGTGMVGKAIKKILPEATYISSKDCDLKSQAECESLFRFYNPEYIIHGAARVGGVKVNMNNLGSFYHDNIMINTNVLEMARKFNVKKALSLLSTCIYPAEATYPLTEEQIHSGPPHFSNYGYAYAKRMLDIQTKTYRQQYDCNFITATPNNMFGEHDNFDLENSHVIPAIIRKIYEAEQNNENVVLWGNGEPLREFTYVGDAAKIILFLLENYNDASTINIGNTGEYSIKYVAETIAEMVGYSNEIIWDTTKPMGQYRKPSDNSKLLSLGWKKENYTEFEESLQKTCDWFVANYPNIRGKKEK